jgi:hypothetical protein
MSHRDPKDPPIAEIVFVGVCLVCCVLFAIAWAWWM